MYVYVCVNALRNAFGLHIMRDPNPAITTSRKRSNKY